MKSKIFLLLVCVVIIIPTKAQLKVLSNGTVQAYNQMGIHSNTSNLSDGLDVVNDNTSLSHYCDLIWGYYYLPQPNNPGILTMQSKDGAYFTVRANGNVGIFNDSPSCALEVGTAGQNQQIKVTTHHLLFLVII